MMLTFSKLVESFKDLEPDVLMSQLDSLKVSFAKLKKHGFDVSAPLTRINELLALKDRQQKAIKEKNGLDKEVIALKEEFGGMEDKILELERQQVVLKEKICQMESCGRDRGVELDNLESEFKATSSAPW
ncbi:BnaA01g33770D [Brassica napus]|uniref:(rape) hypothetical protein n=1 Tax=Brassica napus TaxID=3708 RepID=A0A078G6T1_BRANA|nr:unnamed protein product [Brassica napus]CAF2370177.1 unnamed protein product [Brassica napus]CDY21146.1 BnaA01g33770D [Brassica napus]